MLAKMTTCVTPSRWSDLANGCRCGGGAAGALDFMRSRAPRHWGGGRRRGGGPAGRTRPAVDGLPTFCLLAQRTRAARPGTAVMVASPAALRPPVRYARRLGDAYRVDHDGIERLVDGHVRHHLQQDEGEGVHVVPVRRNDSVANRSCVQNGFEDARKPRAVEASVRSEHGRPHVVE